MSVCLSVCLATTARKILIFKQGICFKVEAKFPRINCYLQSAEVNIILKSEILAVLFILHNYSQHFGNHTGEEYPTVLHRIQITPKTSTNIARYLHSRGPVRPVFSQRASDELD